MRGSVTVLIGCLAAACSGDVFTVDVQLAPNLACEASLQRLQSVEVDVLRQTSGGIEEVGGLGSCEALGGTNRVADLLAPFRAAGVFVEGAPADSRTILRFVGYGRPQCARNSEAVCGITCPPVREDELPADGVRANFVCDQRPLQSQLYNGCLNLELLDAEAQAHLCNPDG